MISGKYIREDPAVQGGRPVIVGTRLTVDAVRIRIKRGDSPESLAEDYPYVSAEVWAQAAAAWGRDPKDR